MKMRLLMMMMRRDGMKEKRVVFIDFSKGQRRTSSLPAFPDRTSVSVCCCGLFSGKTEIAAAIHGATASS